MIISSIFIPSIDGSDFHMKDELSQWHMITEDTGTYFTNDGIQQRIRINTDGPRSRVHYHLTDIDPFTESENGYVESYEADHPDAKIIHSNAYYVLPTLSLTNKKTGVLENHIRIKSKHDLVQWMNNTRNMNASVRPNYQLDMYRESEVNVIYLIVPSTYRIADLVNTDYEILSTYHKHIKGRMYYGCALVVDMKYNNTDDFIPTVLNMVLYSNIDHKYYQCSIRCIESVLIRNYDIDIFKSFLKDKKYAISVIKPYATLTEIDDSMDDKNYHKVLQNDFPTPKFLFKTRKGRWMTSLYFVDKGDTKMIEFLKGHVPFKNCKIIEVDPRMDLDTLKKFLRAHTYEKGIRSITCTNYMFPNEALMYAKILHVFIYDRYTYTLHCIKST